MEKVIRICEITGKKTVVVEQVDTETAKEIVKKLSREDEFGCYCRVAIATPATKRNGGNWNERTGKEIAYNRMSDLANWNGRLHFR